MARNILRKFGGQDGFELCVWNRTARRSLPLVKEGARLAKTPRECVEGADVVVLMLADARALASVLAGEHGVVAGLAHKKAPRAVVIDMATSGRAAALGAARAVAKAGAYFVDAPVSGTVKPAERGELVALVGGRARDVARAKPVLLAMCKRLIRAGATGQGQALKVVLNGLGAHHFVALTSMLVLGERAGLDRATLMEAFTSGAFASPSYIGKKAKILARDFSPEFSLSLALKDVRVNVELQREVGLDLPVVRACLRAIQSGVREGLGDLDLFALESHFATQ